LFEMAGFEVNGKTQPLWVTGPGHTAQGSSARYCIKFIRDGYL